MSTSFLSQATLTQISIAVGLLTIVSIGAALLRAIYSVGNRLGKFEQNVTDRFDAFTKDSEMQKVAMDKVAAELTGHCDDDKQHVNIRLEEFREQVLNKRLDDMSAKLNLLLTKSPQ